MLLPLPPQEQPDWGCGQSPELCDPRSRGEWVSLLVLQVVRAWSYPQRLSPRDARAFSLQQSEKEGLPGDMGTGNADMGLLCLSDPPVGLCSRRSEASLPWSPVSPAPGSAHTLSKSLLNESLIGSGPPPSPSPGQYLRKKNQELEKLYEEQEVPKPKYW